MAIYQCQWFRVASVLFLLGGSACSALNAKEIGMRNEGKAHLIGSVISTPCSIEMSSRYQAVDFSPITLTQLSTTTAREQQARSFDIELHDCGSTFSSIDSKTWTVRFDGQSVNHVDAFMLQGPSQGLGVSVLDDKGNTLKPGETYPLFESVLRSGGEGQTFFLRYFLQLEQTGMPLQAGNYYGQVRFFIDYQ